MYIRHLISTLIGILLLIVTMAGYAQPTASDDLKAVIIRHGEKPENGDNLSCQGENRALQLPSVLYAKFGSPAFTYVPSLRLDDATKHARMLQTISPFAIKYNLTVNSKFGEKNVADVVKEIKKKTGTVLLVWGHSAIPDLAKALGVKHPPGWDGKDFDSIWIITYSKGVASLSFDQEGLQPSAECSD
jgi:hypothetical protein